MGHNAEKKVMEPRAHNHGHSFVCKGGASTWEPIEAPKRVTSTWEPILPSLMSTLCPDDVCNKPELLAKA